MTKKILCWTFFVEQEKRNLKKKNCKIRQYSFDKTYEKWNDAWGAQRILTYYRWVAAGGGLLQAFGNAIGLSQHELTSKVSYSHQLLPKSPIKHHKGRCYLATLQWGRVAFFFFVMPSTLACNTCQYAWKITFYLQEDTYSNLVPTGKVNKCCFKGAEAIQIYGFEMVWSFRGTGIGKGSS